MKIQLNCTLKENYSLVVGCILHMHRDMKRVFFKYIILIEITTSAVRRIIELINDIFFVLIYANVCGYIR